MVPREEEVQVAFDALKHQTLVIDSHGASGADALRS
jgi:hypothetical protein